MESSVYKCPSIKEYPPIGYHVSISELPIAKNRKATAVQIAISNLTNFECAQLSEEDRKSVV